MAVIAVSGTPVVGLKYTHTTASSADWASVSNSTYFYDLTDKLVYFKNANGDIFNSFTGNITTPVVSQSGIWGVSNSSGAYTYYITYALALAQAISISATSIELFADITIGTALVFTNGININGNGHTVTSSLTVVPSFKDNGVACTSVISNIKLKGVGSQTDWLVSITNTNSNITFDGIIETTGTDGYTVFCNGTWNGGTIKGSTIYSSVVSGTFNNVKSFCYSGSGVAGVPTLNNCTFYSESANLGWALHGHVNNCVFYYNGTYRCIQGEGFINNSKITSIVGIGVLLQTQGTLKNSTVRASGHFAVQNTSSALDAVSNCILESLTYWVVAGNGIYSKNTIIGNALQITFYDTYLSFYDCVFIQKWNSVNAHCIYAPSSGTIISRCTFIVTNATAYPMWADSAITYYYNNLIIKGTTNIKSAIIIQGQTNASDAQGNIVIN